MSSIGSGSGQPHLLALLRAIRLRLENPETETSTGDPAGPSRPGSAEGTGPHRPIPATVQPPQNASPPGAGGSQPRPPTVQTPSGSAVVVPSGSAVGLPRPGVAGPDDPGTDPAGSGPRGGRATSALPGRLQMPALPAGRQAPLPAAPGVPQTGRSSSPGQTFADHGGVYPAEASSSADSSGSSGPGTSGPRSSGLGSSGSGSSGHDLPGAGGAGKPSSPGGSALPSPSGFSAPAGPIRNGQIPAGTGQAGSTAGGHIPGVHVPTGYGPAGQVPPGQALPGQVPPGQVPPGQVPPGQVPPGQVPPGQASPGQASPGPVPGGQSPIGPGLPGNVANLPAPVSPHPGIGGTPGVPALRPSSTPTVPGAAPLHGANFGPLPSAGGPIEPIPPLSGRPQQGNYPPYQPSPGGGDGWPFGPTPFGSPPVGNPIAVPVAPPIHAGGPGHPVDGPDPADDVALHSVQQLLATSLSLAGDVSAVAARLREALVLAQPLLVASLPGSESVQREQLAEALLWLIDNHDDPPAMAAGCGQLGAALREFGVQPQQLQIIGAALAEAMRAGMPNMWRQEYDTAWRSTWQHVQQWMSHGAAEAAYLPVTWAAVVVEHDRRLSDLAVLRVRPYLPMPFRPGQYARIQVAEMPQVWRPYSLAGSPRLDNVLELHVRAKSENGVSGTLVHRTRVGDVVRLSRAEGTMQLPPVAERDLLLIAGDTGVAPLKALLIELAATADPRSAVLFWGVRTLGDLYDIDEISAIARACHRATVIPVISEGEPGPYASGLVTDAVAAYGEWSQHEVYLAGPPPMLVATRAVLGLLGIASAHIHHDPADVDNP